MGSKELNIYDRINEFENESALFEYCFKNTGIPMWLFIRTPLVIKAVRADEPHSHSRKNSSKKTRMLDGFIKGNPFLQFHKDIVYAFWTYEILKIDINGYSNDTTIMPFMQENFRNAVALMNGEFSDNVKLKGEYPSLKSDFFFRNYLGKSDVPKEDVVSIKNLIHYIEIHFPWKLDNQIKKNLHEILIACSKYLEKLINRFSLYLSIVRPKVVIVSCANYVDMNRAALIIACKKHKIVTAEIQHGWIGRKHLQYYYSDFIINNPKCRKVFPDYLLTMGNYWNQQIKVPEKKYTVGCKKNTVKNATQNDSILFAASTDHERYFMFLNAFLANSASEGVTVYFRQHPMWKNNIKYASLKKYCNFKFADEKGLDYYMSKCRYVIVDGSTVCYEALYAKKIVFCFKGAITDLFDISSFSDVKLFEDFYEFLNFWKEREHYIPRKHDDLYETDYKNKYKKFLNMCGCRQKK